MAKWFQTLLPNSTTHHFHHITKFSSTANVFRTAPVMTMARNAKAIAGITNKKVFADGCRSGKNTVTIWQTRVNLKS
jgi:hypothetical protein